MIVSNLMVTPVYASTQVVCDMLHGRTIVAFGMISTPSGCSVPPTPVSLPGGGGVVVPVSLPPVSLPGGGGGGVVIPPTPVSFLGVVTLFIMLITFSMLVI